MGTVLLEKSSRRTVYKPWKYKGRSTPLIPNGSLMLFQMVLYGSILIIIGYEIHIYIYINGIWNHPTYQLLRFEDVFLCGQMTRRCRKRTSCIGRFPRKGFVFVDCPEVGVERAVDLPQIENLDIKGIHSKLISGLEHFFSIYWE